MDGETSVSKGVKSGKRFDDAMVILDDMSMCCK